MIQQLSDAMSHANDSKYKQRQATGASALRQIAHETSCILSM